MTNSGMSLAEICAEIEAVSLRLCEAVDHQSPQYLEHLDKRTRLLEDLLNAGESIWQTGTCLDRERLEKAVLVGQDVAVRLEQQRELCRRQLGQVRQRLAHQQAWEQSLGSHSSDPSRSWQG